MASEVEAGVRRRSCRVRSLSALVCVLACGPTAPPAGQPLSGSFAQLRDGFTFIASVRELSDGALILVDTRESRIVRLRFDSSGALDVGRRGDGPAEWANAYPLFPLGRDSSLLVDQAARRWLLFVGTSIQRAIPTESPLHELVRDFVIGAASSGDVLSILRPRVIADMHRDKTDSIPLTLASLTGAVDTVAMLRDAPADVVTAQTDDGRVVPRGISRPAFSVGEEAAIFRDGWIAIARLEPFRVDWLLPDRTIRFGEPIEMREVRLDQREKDAYLSRNAEIISGLENVMPEIRTALMRRFTEFPSSIPPFEASALIAGADGCLYIRRTPLGALNLPRFDVVDRSGRRRSTFTLDANERLVGVGDRGVYVASKDSDDVEWLRQYPPLTSGSCG